MQAGKPFPQGAGERPLVGGVDVREEQADRNRLGFELADRRDDPGRLVGFEFLDHPVGPDALAERRR